MELKKNKKYDLESKRPLFFGIGMIISISLTILAFEWKSPIDPVVDIIEEGCAFGFSMNDATLPPEPPITIWSRDGSVSILSTGCNTLTNSLDVTLEGFPSTNSYFIDEMTFSIVEVMPEFDGGFEGLKKSIEENLVYPSRSKKLGIEGRVFVQFVVEKDGTLSNFKVIKGINKELDAEAVRLVKNAPQASPGRIGEIPVRVKMILPISFEIE